MGLVLSGFTSKMGVRHSLGDIWGGQSLQKSANKQYLNQKSAKTRTIFNT